MKKIGLPTKAISMAVVFALATTSAPAGALAFAEESLRTPILEQIAQAASDGASDGAHGGDGSATSSVHDAPGNSDAVEGGSDDDTGNAGDTTDDAANGSADQDAPGTSGDVEDDADGEPTNDADATTDTINSAHTDQADRAVAEALAVQDLTAAETIAPLSIDTDDPAQMRVLEQNRFTGLNPANTVVNLFDYTSYLSEAGNDEQLSSLPPSEWLGSADDPNINTGRMLTFGNGMNRDMGYWNAGSGSGMGDFAKNNPGFQNIVSPTLGADGYPQISTESTPVYGMSAVNNVGALVAGIMEWPQVGGYASNPPLYANAVRVNAQWSNGQPVFPYAGGKNISDTVQNQWNGNRSLSYLFDPAQADAAGRTETHTDVKGLFQLEDGYYTYNMRKNFAQYTAEPVQGRDGTIEANSFVLYDAPAGLRTDNANSVGNFFPFNTGEEVFRVEGDQLVSDVYAANSGAEGSASNQGQNKPFMNHSLGLSMETAFRQPVGGTVGDDPMTFEFIGDDDMWVFIDDVLVLDLGGIHSELYGTIDFSTGTVNLGTAFGSNGQITTAPVRSTTIKQMFESAGKDTSEGFTGNTFASNTSHTLKMFYLERGNYDSSLSVRFNLQPELYQQIKKVDQDGNPVQGAVFDLYPVDSTTAAGADQATLDNVTYRTDAAARLTSVTTREDGTAQFTDDGQPFNFADRVTGDVASQLFVLRESSAPPGYRMMPIDILMRFDRETGTFVVNNRYDTGAYASFNSYVTQTAPNHLRYGSYDAASGTIVNTDAPVSIAQQSGGLVVAVPTLRQESDGVWKPIYGNNNDKLTTISYDATDVNAMRQAMLEAVLHQAYLSQQPGSRVPGWYLEWTGEGRLASYHEEAQRTSGSPLKVVCTLSELPGNPTRYRLNNPNGDMQMIYGIISSDAFASTGMEEADKYASLAQRVSNHLAGVAQPTEAQLDAAVRAAAAEIVSTPTSGASGAFGTRGFNAIEANDLNQFERNFRTLINVPNEQRELRVWKVDQNDNRVNGAAFGLFGSKEDAESAVRVDIDGNDAVTRIYDTAGNEVHAYAAGVTGDLRGAETRYQGDDIEGMLIFAPYVTNGAGAAHTEWTVGDDGQNGRVLYLKEIQAPAGFNPNDTIIPVVIGQYGIYADAGTTADGVDVLAGVGKLSATMTKYAASPDFNLTLRYITSVMQTQESSAVPTGAQSVSFEVFNRSWQASDTHRMNMEYGVNALVDYGSPDGFTEAELEAGIGYIDAAGNQRPLFRTATGFVRAAPEQDTEALERALTSGPYRGVSADLLSDASLVNVFAIRNTVRVTDVKRPTAQIAKVDQDGNPVAQASFELYAVDALTGTTEEGLAEVTLEEVADRMSSAPVAMLTTDATGMSSFYQVDANGQPASEVLDFAQRAAQLGMNGGRLYVLRETQRPPGYRQMRTDVLFHYLPATGMLVVNNTYQTGASAGFASLVTVDSDIHYATYGNGELTVDPSDHVSSQTQRDGLVVTVPTIVTDEGWRPLYGDVTAGYQAVAGSDARALLEAALQQAAGAATGAGKPWHLSWNSSLASLTGQIEGLPGVADDYRLYDPDGTLQMVYAVISPEALKAAGVDAANSHARYEQLAQKVADQGLDRVLATITGQRDGFRPIDASDFDRAFQPIIYIPNEQRELRLWKTNEAGERIDGAAFALFESRGDAERAADATIEDAHVTSVTDAAGNVMPVYAAGVTGVPHNGDAADNQHGTIVFAPYVEDGEGTAQTLWIDSEGNDLLGKALYLREVKAPTGYERNDTIIPVVVGLYGVYADAGTSDDGVDVLAGVGKLSATMTKLASSTDVDLTLRFITSQAETQPSLKFNADQSIDDGRVEGSSLNFDAFNDDWRGTEKKMNLVYGDDNALVSYGHPGEFSDEELAEGIGCMDAYGEQRPLFRAEEGFVRPHIEQDTQTMRAAQEEQGDGAASAVHADDLEGIDLGALFSVRNTVRVVDQKAGETPDDPDDPNVPGDPRLPGTGDGQNPDVPRKGALLARTGDEMFQRMLILMLATTALTCSVIGVRLLRTAHRIKQQQ